MLFNLLNYTPEYNKRKGNNQLVSKGNKIVLIQQIIKESQQIPMLPAVKCQGL